MTDRQGTQWLGVIVLLATLVRLPDFTAPFILANDWSFAQFTVYARNYRDLGPLLEWTIPCFGVVDGRGIVYANHPWFASLMLGVWGLAFDYAEVASRSLGLIFSLVSIFAVARIGEMLGGVRAGLMSAVLFGFAPLAIHFGRVYCMEPVHIAFLLLAYGEFMRWRRSGSRYTACVIYLALAQASDIYALFLCPWLFFLWLSERLGSGERRSTTRWWGLMLTPVVVQAGLMAIVAQRSLGQHTWERGVSRAGNPWHDWVDPSYWTDFAGKLLLNYGYTLPLLAVIGLVAWRRWPSEQRQLGDLGFWWFYGALYTLLGTEWMKHHLYLVVFWGPALALQSGLFLSRIKASVGWSVVLLQSLLSLQVASKVYYGIVPLHIPEMRFAEQLRKDVRQGDLIVGLPPHIAYEVDHKAAIPYDYFVRRDLSQPAELNALIREIVGDGRFERVLICPRFIQYPKELASQDLPNLYPADGPYRLVHQSDVLLIWERHR